MIAVILKNICQNNMSRQKITFNKLPLIIFTDSHCNLANIKKLQQLYPVNQIISLGDFTNLWNKKELFNSYSIDYFIKNKIKSLCGNHESFIAFQDEVPTLKNVIGGKFDNGANHSDIYNITTEQKEYLKSLPLSFEIDDLNGEKYLCFHNLPNCLWTFTEKMNDEEFVSSFDLKENDKNLTIISGHLHLNIIEEHSNNNKRIIIGSLKDGDYAVIGEHGLEFKKL